MSWSVMVRQPLHRHVSYRSLTVKMDCIFAPRVEIERCEGKGVGAGKEEEEEEKAKKGRNEFIISMNEELDTSYNSPLFLNFHSTARHSSLV